MYYFFLDKILLPIAPASLTVDTGSSNKTYTLLNDGEINIIKSAPLQTISFTFTIPSVEHPYALYSSGFLSPTIYLEYMKKLKEDKKPFQFIVSRQLPSGKILYVSNTKVSLESYTVDEDAEDGFDFEVTVELKEYREKSTSVAKILSVASVAIASVQTVRETKNSPAPKSTVKKYTVKKGDTLWAIAKKYYGDGSKYTKIAKENKISNPNLINVGQVLTIPKV